VCKFSLVTEARDFKELYNEHWNNRVSSIAKRRQKLRHINKPGKVPITSEWMEKELKKIITENNTTRNQWGKSSTHDYC
jgi:hypothetical protein